MPLQPFSGMARKLVLAFDVSTTYSGIAYAILDPGEVPKIQGVTRFPGQENAAGDSKIQSILYYDRDGRVRAVGAEVALPSMNLQVEDEDLLFVEWFKLHLRPDFLDSGEVNKNVLPPLPLKKTVIDVFGDFLKYLFLCARRYITETHANGQQLWTSLENQIEIVLSHPNGWEGLQQTKMRRAAIAAGLIQDTPQDHNRIHFVTEGEEGQSVMIIDAGGGTVDLSTYTFTSVSLMSVEEISPPDCLMQGSIGVNARAHKYLEALLRNSKYGNPMDLKSMTDYFEKYTKPIFTNSNEPGYIRFGAMDCNDLAVKIRRGQFTLSGETVATFFEPSIKAITDTVKRQCQTAREPVKLAFLVGGFAASPWLFKRLQASLQQIHTNLVRPDSYTNKAIAEGAVSFYLEHFVAVRMARVTYGTPCLRPYDPNDKEHYQRWEKIITRPSGHLVLPDAFGSLLQKGMRMHDSDEVIHSFVKEAHEASLLDKISSEITCYRGKSKTPCWMDVEPERFSVLCTVYADISDVVKTENWGSNSMYYSQEFKIVLLCDLTELKAQLCWSENEEEKLGPAKIVYDDDAEVEVVVLTKPDAGLHFNARQAQVERFDIHEIAEDMLTRAPHLSDILSALLDADILLAWRRQRDHTKSKQRQKKVQQWRTRKESEPNEVPASEPEDVVNAETCSLDANMNTAETHHEDERERDRSHPGGSEVNADSDGGNGSHNMTMMTMDAEVDRMAVDSEEEYWGSDTVMEDAAAENAGQGASVENVQESSGVDNAQESAGIDNVESTGLGNAEDSEEEYWQDDMDPDVLEDPDDPESAYDQFEEKERRK
ncbi:hypothetical protein SCP_0204720 [Sparassis crispa]|uniref:Uncharacterized protein n=1 Tax=Sparassis crispa TaxID=139825 RepID=A0A401GAS8_9APHY|nr:hypothetical protein SCP_0204720 [Sparassis crispa]GBE79274.1 hypothetical protein SCP_0204720 [Sparassis crispa]